MAAYGGMERHVCVLALEAAARGHHVRLLTTSDSLNADARAALHTAGIDFRELSRPRGEASKLQKLLWLWRETFRARPTRWDLIYTNGQSALASIVWRAAESGGRTRIVHHHHTAADAAEQTTWAPGFRRVLARASEIIACSEATRTGIEQALNRHTGVRFLPYFTACPVSSEQVRETSLAPGRPIHIGFLGRLVSTKGIDILCALSLRPELTGVIWHIHGEGSEYPESHFAAFPTIRYHGPYRDLVRHGEILRSLDAVALFSIHNEGMPLSLIETMSAGLPWIATDRGGTREIALAPANCVILDHPCTVESALAGVAELVRRLRTGQTSRLSQRAAYESRFAPEVVSRQWFDYLEKKPVSAPLSPQAASPSPANNGPLHAAMRFRSAAVRSVRRGARHFEKLLRRLRVYTLVGLRELAFTRTRLQLPRNQPFPIRSSQADGVAIRLVDPDEPFDRPLPNMPGEPVCHPSFLQHQRGVIPASFVAEIQGARIWGDYNAAILTADGRLIQELSKDMWGPVLHNIYTRIRLPRPRLLKGRTLSLITPEAANNYHHWMVDLLPRAGLVERAGWDLRAFDHILIKDRQHAFQRETLRRLGLDESRLIRVRDNDHFQAETLVVPSIHLNNTLVSPVDLRYVRQLFLPADPAKPHRRLYLGRRDAAHRRVVNEAALLPILHAHGFEEVSMAGLTVAQQARMLSEAVVVVAPNGSALANLLFAPPGCHVIEFLAPGWVVVFDWMICVPLDIKHTALIGRGPRPNPQNPPRGLRDDIDLDPALLEKALGALPPLKS
jgi:capsular polysaccharide biosynthesis protein/glycosyltransferase involved in cell wall biosynthesis